MLGRNWPRTRSREPSRIRKFSSAPVWSPWRCGYEPAARPISFSTSPLTIAMEPVSCTPCTV